MDCKDYAAFVINNMYRASLSNALNISHVLVNEQKYDICEFVENIIEFVESKLPNELNKDVVYSIVLASNKFLKKYRSDVKYNVLMLVDNLIIEFWRVLHGH